MSINDLHLILQVKQNNVLYDSRTDGFRDKDAKELAWVGIANVMGVDVQEVKSRWNYLRQRYSVELKCQKEKDKSARRTIFPLFQAMEFLHPFVKPRMRVSASAEPHYHAMYRQYTGIDFSQPASHGDEDSQNRYSGEYPASTSSLRSASDDADVKTEVEQFLEDDDDLNGPLSQPGNGDSIKTTGNGLESEDETSGQRCNSAFSAIRTNSEDPLSNGEAPHQQDELPNEPMESASSQSQPVTSRDLELLDPPIKQMRFAIDPRANSDPSGEHRFVPIAPGPPPVGVPRYLAAAGPHYFPPMSVVPRMGVTPAPPAISMPLQAAPIRDELDHFAAHLVSEMRLLSPDKQALLKIRIHESLYQVRFGPVPREEPSTSH